MISINEKEETMSETKEVTTIDDLTPEQRENVLLMLHGDIMQQLLQRPRFQMFLAANYEIKPRIDDEAQSVNMVVMERTENEVADYMMKIMNAKKDDLVIASPQDLKQLKLDL